MVYLHEHYGGVSTISSLIAHSANGINSINAVLSARGYSQDFEDVFSDWKIANFLDDTTFASGKYGYESLDLKAECSKKHFSFPVSNTFRDIQSWAADYIEFTGGDRVSDLQIDFAARNPSYSFDVRAIVMKNDRPVAVESMGSDGHISIPEFGYAVDTVILVPNWKPRSEFDFGEEVFYSYSAGLGAEMTFDVAVLPNAIHERYMDVVVQLDDSIGTDTPKITVTNLGKKLVSEQDMVPVRESVYIYQLYIPYGWNGSEVKWDISYRGKSLSAGNLGNIY